MGSDGGRMEDGKEDGTCCLFGGEGGFGSLLYEAVGSLIQGQ